jgi:PEP-CTERM motif
MSRLTVLAFQPHADRFRALNAHRLGFAVCFLASLAWATTASAALFHFSGTSSDSHAVSGTADFTLNAAADTVTVKLGNTTTTTNDAGELFTGLDFSLGGLMPTMTSDTGIERTVNGAGSFVDTGAAQNLSWSLVSLGSGMYQLNFNPNAEHGIIGPPTAGSYSGANGSIKGNAGHNPFAAEMAVFVLSVPGLEANTAVDAKVFRYGTGLNPASGTITFVPEPSTIVLLAMAAAAFSAGRRIRASCGIRL